jgi:hypothetical protein
MVAPAAATTVAAAAPKAKGGALSARGEVSALAVVMNEAGAATRRLKEVTEALSQVRRAGLRSPLFFSFSFFSFFYRLLGPRSYDCSAGG